MRHSLLAVVGTVLLAACGGGTAPAASSGSAAGRGGTEVHVSDFAIKPAELQAQGGKVALAVKNDGPTPHNLTVKDGSGKVVLHSRDLKPGESETISADLQAGTYRISCSLPGHESLGMTGTLKVG